MYLLSEMLSLAEIKIRLASKFSINQIDVD